jgi:parvulin-like peptidyl-prolyl isomerase
MDVATYAPLSEEEAAAKKKLAEDTLEALKKGGDFDALMETLGEDPGITPEGYTLSKPSGMVQPFEDAAFALEMNETSGVVPTDYGYHILKRFPLLTGGEAAYYLENARAQLLQEKLTAYLDALTSKYAVVVNQEVFDSIPE